MDLSAAANWLQILSVVVPLLASGLIWLLIRPLKEHLKGLQDSMKAFRAEFDAHDKRDIDSFKLQESQMQEKLVSLRTELDNDRREAFTILREDLQAVTKGLNGIKNFLMQQASHGSSRSQEVINDE